MLLDQNMPGMTGMQLAAKIKEDPSLNHDILLVMLTGISNAPSKIIARNCGIKRILAKPVAGYTLKTTLADAAALTFRPHAVHCCTSTLRQVSLSSTTRTRAPLSGLSKSEVGCSRCCGSNGNVSHRLVPLFWPVLMPNSPPISMIN